MASCALPARPTAARLCYVRGMTTTLDALAGPFRTAYLDHAALTTQLTAWAGHFPDLCRLESIGRTPEGRDLAADPLRAILWCTATGRGRSERLHVSCGSPWVTRG